MRISTSLSRLCAISLMLFAAQTSLAQNNITGLIKDENGKVIAGANILIKGTPQGTVTDSLGNFELAITPGDNVLHIAYVKHKSLDILILVKPSYNYIINTVLVRDIGKNRNRESACEIQASH